MEFFKELETSGSPLWGKKERPEGGCRPVEEASSICLGTQVGGAEEAKYPSCGPSAPPPCPPAQGGPVPPPSLLGDLSEQWRV